jgi:hypothetical protein
MRSLPVPPFSRILRAVAVGAAAGGRRRRGHGGSRCLAATRIRIFGRRVRTAGRLQGIFRASSMRPQVVFEAVLVTCGASSRPHQAPPWAHGRGHQAPLLRRWHLQGRQSRPRAEPPSWVWHARASPPAGPWPSSLRGRHRASLNTHRVRARRGHKEVKQKWGAERASAVCSRGCTRAHAYGLRAESTAADGCPYGGCALVRDAPSFMSRSAHSSIDPRSSPHSISA